MSKKQFIKRSTTMKQLPNRCYGCKYIDENRYIFGLAYCTKYNVKIRGMECCEDCDEK